MRKMILDVLILTGVLGLGLWVPSTNASDPALPPEAVRAAMGQAPLAGPSEEYTIGPDDALDICVMRPEVLVIPVTVSADGFISMPYIGGVLAKGKTLSGLQQEITQKLGDGYMKYPVVSVTLKASLSRKFFIYGEIIRPGSYPMEENITVFRALAIAGGFTKFGSSSKVKILRPKTNKPGYDVIKVDIKAVMNGKSDSDVLLRTGDVIVVAEGIF